ncbi:hypothetical protein GB937_010886 [Aspergillus fischeri]|nr:hypothetical protein GB937_010886 [Aspergillus fischeri]
MSYKRIREKGMNEVVFATYLHSHGKIKVLDSTFKRSTLNIIQYYGNSKGLLYSAKFTFSGQLLKLLGVLLEVQEFGAVWLI